MYVMENALYIIMSQATRYLRDPNLVSTDKQLLKRELGTEMVRLLSHVKYIAEIFPYWVHVKIGLGCMRISGMLLLDTKPYTAL